MSQADLAILLGWGEVTITRYETKSIQDETYDQLIRMVKDDPYYALERLKNSVKSSQMKSMRHCEGQSSIE